MTKKIISGLLFFFIFLYAVSNTAHAQINLNQSLAQDTTVTVGKLANGLTYYIKPNAEPAEKVELRLVVKAGSILENNDQQGLAHFMEHMEFRGTTHFPQNELINYLQKIGVRFGADLNANTSWDRTYFILPVPTDDPGNLEKGFQILGDWAGGALIQTKAANEERHVILEELRMRNLNAQTRMMNKYYPAMLNDSRYAYRLPGGKDSIVLNADPELIRKFYHDWYRPDLLAFIVVGDITVSHAKELIEKYFGDLKDSGHERERVYYHVLPYTSTKAMIVTDAEADRYRFTLMYPAHKRAPEKTIGDFRNELIRDIFIQSLNRKLRDMAQSPNPPFAEAQASLSGAIGGIALQDEGFELDVAPLKNVKASIDAAIEELLNVAKFGFTEKDIQMMKAAYLSAYRNAFNERYKTPSADYTNDLVNNFMKGTPLMGITNEYNYVRELLPTITLKDVDTFAGEELHIPPHYFTLMTGPSKGDIMLPSEAGLLQIVTAAFRQKTHQRASQVELTTLLQQQPKPGTIISEKKNAALGTTTFRLSNGVKVTVKPTIFQQDQILLSGVKYGGTGLFGISDKSNVTFLPDVIGTMGYGKFTPAALDDFLSDKNVNLNVNMTGISDEVNGSSSVSDISTLLQLVYLELTAPRKDTALLSGWINKVETQIPLFHANPQIAFKDSLIQVMYGDNLLSPIIIPSKQEINEINVDRILNIYREQFGNARGFHFFLIGNVNIDTLRPLMEKYLASLPVQGKMPKYKDNGLRMVNGDKAFRFYQGTDQKSMILDIYHGNIQYSPELALGADMLAQAMTIEMLDTIREKMHAIYSGGVSASVIKLPYGHYSIAAQMPCGPGNVQKIMEGLNKEVAAYKEYGVSSTDLEKVKKAMIEQYKEEIKQNGAWLGALKQILFWGENKDNFLHYEQRVNNVTTTDLKTTANKLLGNNNFLAITYPERDKK